MSSLQSIQHQISALPEAAQQELAGFLDILVHKYVPVEQEHRGWSDFSLTSAMRGIK
jgi:hypothetical protein